MGIDDKDAARVRRMLGEFQGHGRRRVFSQEAKRSAVALARRAKQTGVSVASVAKRLGVHPLLLGEWARRLADPPDAGFARAHVIDGPVVAVAAQGRVVHPASGWHVEGLTVSQIAELLGRLSCSA